MGIINEILVGRFNRGIQKLLAIKGSPSTPQVAGEFYPTIDTMEGGVENRFLFGWNRYGTGLVAAGAAGQISPVRFRNPAGSNVLAVLEKIQVSFTDNPDSDFSMQAADGTTGDLSATTTGIGLDFRTSQSFPGSNSVCILSQQSLTASLPFTIMRWHMLRATVVDLILTRNQEITVLPSVVYQWQGGGTQQLQVSVIWRERFLEDSERQ